MDDRISASRSSNLRSSVREALAEAARQGDIEVAEALRRILAKIGPLMSGNVSIRITFD